MRLIKTIDRAWDVRDQDTGEMKSEFRGALTRFGLILLFAAVLVIGTFALSAAIALL